MKSKLFMFAFAVLLSLAIVNAYTWEDDLQHWWTFNETAGTVVTDIRGGEIDIMANGTLSGTTIKHMPIGFLNAALNKSDETTVAYVNMSGTEHLFDRIFNGTSAFSVSVWIKSYTAADSDRSGETIIGKGGNLMGVGFFSIGFNDDGTNSQIELFMEDDNAGRYRVETIQEHITDDDTWNHIVITYNGTSSDGNSTVIYINGTSVSVQYSAANTFNASIGLNNSFPLRFFWGYTEGTTGIFKGAIDEVGIWERVLTVSEVGDLYNSGAGASYSIDPFRIVEETYATSVRETSSQDIDINITFNSTLYTTVTGTLNYNGTNYTGSSVGAGDNLKFNRTIDTPTINIGGVIKQFYWEFEMINSSGSKIYPRSPTRNQTINKIQINLCNATYNVSFINFTIIDTDTDNEANATLKVSWDIYFGEGAASINQSFQNLSETKSKYDFCFDPSSGSYTADAQIEYDAVGFAKNYYYLSSMTLTNTTSLINLHLLNDSKATTTVLKVYDDTQAPLENVYIQIQAYDVGTDTYSTVAMARTDYNGEDVAYLNWYDTFYKFILIRNDVVASISNSSKISDTPKIFEVPLVFTFPFDEFDDLTYTLVFNNVTENFVLTYVEPTGSISAGCLRVIKRSIQNDTVICDTCEESSSATIYCNVAGRGNGTFIATFYGKGSPIKVIETLIHLKNVANRLYEKIGKTDGAIYAFLFTGLILMLFFVHPVFGVIGALLGIGGSMALGFQPLNYGEFIVVIIVGGFIIWLIKR